MHSDKLVTNDGVEISYEHFKNGHDSLVIICPGFFNSKANGAIRLSIGLVEDSHDVIIFDFRGHGESGGKFTWTSREALDLEAVLDYAVSQGYKKIGLMGFSLGAAISIIVAARRPEIKSIILVSAPTGFWRMDYNFWEPGMLSDLKANLECKWEGKGVRPGSIFLPKIRPIDRIADIKEAPILFIHGDRDWVIKDYHSKKLYDAATVKSKKLVIIQKGLHAERLIEEFPERMKELVAGWFKETL
ncbi:MAG: alpha/beta fold hydrolase [Candidatus Omnitrophota bacterium]|jgi:pimeloyl-ACP methyl ester carboxylesterase